MWLNFSYFIFIYFFSALWNLYIMSLLFVIKLYFFFRFCFSIMKPAYNESTLCVFVNKLYFFFRFIFFSALWNPYIMSLLFVIKLYFFFSIMNIFPIQACVLSYRLVRYGPSMYRQWREESQKKEEFLKKKKEREAEEERQKALEVRKFLQLLQEYYYILQEYLCIPVLRGGI